MSRTGNAQSKLIKDFDSAKTAKEMLKKFQKLEEKLSDDGLLLGMSALQLSQQFRAEGNDPEQVLLFGKKGLKFLIATEDQYNMNMDISSSTTHLRPWPLLIASILTLLGEACFQLSRFDESLCYLNWANRNFCNLESDVRYPTELILGCKLDTENHLFRVKKSMERNSELVVHAMKILEIKEKIYEEDNYMEFGTAYEDILYSYCVVDNFKEALPFCLRAVEMRSKHFGPDSLQVAPLRRNLAMIYSGLKEYEKAIEQNQLVLSVLKESTSCVGVLMDNGEMLIHLGRYGEALALLKGVVSNAAADEIRAEAYVFMAKALVGLENYGDAKNHMKRALKLFNKEGMDPDFVINGLRHMACLYEELKDFEAALSTLLRLLRMTNLPQGIIREYSTRHAELIMRKEKAVEGQGPSEEDKQDEAFALLKLMKENIHGTHEEYSAKKTESINSKDRKASSSR